MIAWLRAQWYRLFRDHEPYDGQFAGDDEPTVPLPLGGDILPDGSPAVQRAEPFTGDNVTLPPAIVAADDISTYESSKDVEDIVRKAQAGYRLYRANGLLNFGGAPELGPGARWTKRGGWKPGRRVR